MSNDLWWIAQERGVRSASAVFRTGSRFVRIRCVGDVYEYCMFSDPDLKKPIGETAYSGTLYDAVKRLHSLPDKHRFLYVLMDFFGWPIKVRFDPNGRSLLYTAEIGDGQHIEGSTYQYVTEGIAQHISTSALLGADVVEDANSRIILRACNPNVEVVCLRADGFKITECTENVGLYGRRVHITVHVDKTRFTEVIVEDLVTALKVAETLCGERGCIDLIEWSRGLATFSSAFRRQTGEWCTADSTADAIKFKGGEMFGSLAESVRRYCADRFGDTGCVDEVLKHIPENICLTD